MLTLVVAPGLNQVEKQPFADVLPWLYKKVFIKILQNSKENTCTEVSLLIKLQVWGLQFY